MGFLDWLFKDTKCPACGTRGVSKSLGRIRCSNPSCGLFDGPAAGRRSDYSPEHPIQIRYRNFQGQEKTFTAEVEALERKHNHILAEVAPTGERIALSRDRIQNLAEVDRAAQARPEPPSSGPTPRERQVLAYHKKHGSTSPLYEEIRTKHPEW